MSHSYLMKRVLSLINALHFFLSPSFVFDSTSLFLWIPVFLGIGIGLFLGLPFEPPVTGPLVLLILLSGTLLFFRDNLFLRAATLVAFGFMAAFVSSSRSGTFMFDHPVGPLRVQGEVSDIEYTPKGQRMVLKNLTLGSRQENETPRALRLNLSDKVSARSDENVDIGHRYSFVAQIMPFSEPLFPGGFDFRRHAYFQGLGGTGYVLGKIERLDTDVVEETYFFQRLKISLQKDIRQTLSSDRAALAIAFLTGDQLGLSADVTSAFRQVGISHLLSVSGLHIGLAGGLVFFVVRFLLACFPPLALRWPLKKIAAFCALVSITFYTLQVGAPVPAQRSLIMAGLVFIGVLVDRVSLSLRSVALAATALLILWPFVLVGPSFQLSFAAVVALVALHEERQRKKIKLFASNDGWIASVLRFFVDMVGVSLVATLATIPLTLYHFQQISFYGVIANILAVPLSSFLIMPLCVIVDLLWPFGATQYPLMALGWSFGLLIDLATFFAGLQGASYVPPYMPFGWMLVSVMGGLILCLVRARIRLIGAAMIFVAVAVCFVLPSPDLLISADGKQVVVRTQDSKNLVLLSQDKEDDFILSAWERRMRATGDEKIADPSISCDGMACVIEREGKRLLFVKDASVMAHECKEMYDLILLPSSAFYCSNALSPQINRVDAGRSGAMDLRMTKDGIVVSTSRDDYALRPWTRGWSRSHTSSTP